MTSNSFSFDTVEQLLSDITPDSTQQDSSFLFNTDQNSSINSESDNINSVYKIFPFEASRRYKDFECILLTRGKTVNIYSCGCIGYEGWDELCDFKHQHNKIPVLVCLVASLTIGKYGKITIQASGHNTNFIIRRILLHKITNTFTKNWIQQFTTLKSNTLLIAGSNIYTNFKFCLIFDKLNTDNQQLEFNLKNTIVPQRNHFYTNIESRDPVIFIWGLNNC